MQIGTSTTWATGDSNKIARGVEANNFSGAIKTDGTLWSWGNSSYGCLGQNSAYADRSSPTQVGTDTTWQNVFAGSRATYASKTDNTFWVWGHNQFGALGLNQDQPTKLSSPTQLPGTNWGNKMQITEYGGTVLQVDS